MKREEARKHLQAAGFVFDRRTKHEIWKRGSQKFLLSHDRDLHSKQEARLRTALRKASDAITQP
jgi:ribosomal protein L31E